MKALSAPLDLSSAPRGNRDLWRDHPGSRAVCSRAAAWAAGNGHGSSCAAHQRVAPSSTRMRIHSARTDLHEFYRAAGARGSGLLSCPHGRRAGRHALADLRMVLTRTSEVIPIADGRMQLGTWQGIFLFEHRRAPHRRECRVDGDWGINRTPHGAALTLINCLPEVPRTEAPPPAAAISVPARHQGPFDS